MAMATPDWLQKRDGLLKQSIDGNALTVYLNSAPLYVLRPIPAQGKWACRITQTNNGHRLDQASLAYATQAEAFQGGLQQLQTVLGW